MLTAQRGISKNTLCAKLYPVPVFTSIPHGIVCHPNLGMKTLSRAIRSAYSIRLETNEWLRSVLFSMSAVSRSC
jgi:hypothetical protein